MKNKDSNYDYVNPDHYKMKSVETIDKMIAIWGVENTAMHCEMCAFKYRERIGLKPGQPIEQEMKKIKWYEDKAVELRAMEEAPTRLQHQTLLDKYVELKQRITDGVYPNVSTQRNDVSSDWADKLPDAWKIRWDEANERED
jgi:hypothetical protein